MAGGSGEVWRKESGEEVPLLQMCRLVKGKERHRTVGRAFSSLRLPPSLLRSDLALRNCLLTSDLTVRIGDYGLAHSNYKVGSVCACVYACGSVCITC